MKLFDLGFLSQAVSWLAQSPATQEALKQAIPGFLGFGTGDEAAFGEAYTKLPDADRAPIDQLLQGMEKWEQSRLRQVVGKMTVENAVTETIYTPGAGGGKKEIRTQKDLRVEFLKILAEQVRTLGVDETRRNLVNKGIIIPDPIIKKAYEFAVQGMEKTADWAKTGKIFPAVPKKVWLILGSMIVVMLILGQCAYSM